MNSNNQNNQIEDKLQKAFKKESKSVIGFFIHKYRFTYLLLFVITVIGIYSLLSMPKEAEPEIKIPYGMVNTLYPGASPTDIEELVTNKIEDKIKDLDNLKTFNSQSSESISSIFIEFEAEADLQESFRKLREAVDDAKSNLPGEAEVPVVTEMNFSDFPVITYSLVGNYNDIELKTYADKLQEELESIKGVSEAKVIGGLEREYQVMVDEAKIINFGVSLGQVVNSIQLSNFNLPTGNIEVDGFEYNVRVVGKFDSIDDLKNTIITTRENTPIYIKDVADIKDGYKKKQTTSKIGFPGESAKNTISLQIYKKTGGNILKIVEDAEIFMSKVHEKQILPPDLAVLKTNDNSVFIKDDIKTLGFSAIQTFLLILLILFAILSFRGSIITALAVPISFLMSFVLLHSWDMTLNSMVLFSLVLSLGLMVDNSIIIIEGINEYMEIHQKTVMEAAILAVWNYKWPIIAGTMTTVAAFVGLFLVSGIMGEYLSIIPKTLITTLLSSLLVALILIPMLATRFLKVETNGKISNRSKKRHVVIAGIREKLQLKYATLLKSILPNKKRRRGLIVAAWLFFAVSIILPIVGIMKIEMFPVVDFEYFNINIELPVGSSLEKTTEVTRKVEDIVGQIPELDNFVTSIGQSASGFAGNMSSSGDYLANITVNLIGSDRRNRKSFEIAEDIRPTIAQVQGGRASLFELQAGPPTGAPIEVRIYGTDPEDMALATKAVKKYFEDIKGVINIEDNAMDSAGEFAFTIDKTKADYYGMSVSDIAGNLRTALYGTKASEVTIKKEDVDITVRYGDGSFNDVNDLENLSLFTKAGEIIPLKQVANLKFSPALLSINHRNGQRIITVTGNTEKGVNIRKIMADFTKESENLNIPKSISLDIGGETEDIQKSFTEMFLSLGVAIILIYTILVLVFNSFIQPFIILFSLPLAIPGVILALSLLGQAFSITAFIGIVSLSGIVVNDAIVLIDRINKNIKDGSEFESAIINAGASRMQPIFVTSITTIAGVFPLYFANEMWRGLSVSIMAGLSLATILTLVIIPAMYYGLCHKLKCTNQGGNSE